MNRCLLMKHSPCFFLVSSFIARIYRVKVVQYISFCILLILLFNPLNYSYTVTKGDMSVTHHSTVVSFLSINPIILIVLILYILVNNGAVVESYSAF